MNLLSVLGEWLVILFLFYCIFYCYEVVGLLCLQLCVQFFVCDQFGMCVGFDDVVFVYYYQLVYVGDGGQVMCDGDYCFVLYEQVEVVLDGGFGF